MVRLRFLVIAVLCISLAGCSVPASKTVETAKVETTKESKEERTVKFHDIEPGEATESQKQKEKVKEVETEKKQQPENKPEVPSPTQPEFSPAKLEKLDKEALEKLDNTRYAWWITMNKEHKTPGIPAVAQKMIAQNDGIYIGDISKKTVYLTFDEGYENGYTSRILDTLKENQVKALFFVTGPYIKTQEALVKRMLQEGHQVGNHSINHPSLPAVTIPALENELFGLEKEFGSRYGKGFKYMRPPRGEYSERTLAAAKALGYKTIFWSFAYRDFETNNQKGADYAYNMVMKNLHHGAVILLHAVSKDNAEALDRIIKGIQEEGYTISPFDL
ncbi:MAG: delta-lactam-biosynthetic de-N-acetylase [Clostridia bacterium]|nr:delta-lactam-biosynthetic de-N-acetylase [Clostridia bacterium]